MSSNRTQATQKALIISGLFMCTISDGYIIGHFSGMVAAQEAENTDVPLTSYEMTWLASTSYATTMFGFAFAAVVSEKFGRRKSITILTVPVAVSWIMMYYGQSMAAFLIAKIISGLSFGGVFSLCILCTSEYTTPNLRGMYLNMIMTGATSLGVTLAHILGILFHWRTVILAGLIPTTISAIMPLFWVESPLWFAYKGRFDECITAFTTLHGTGKEAQAELQLLLKVERKKQSEVGGASVSFQQVLKNITYAIKQKYLKKITLLALFLHLYRIATARLLVATFGITIMQHLTGTSDILFFTFFVDGCFVLGSFMSCILIGKMKMRTLLFSGGIAANVALIALSISIWYSNSPWLNCVFLGIFVVIVNAGPYPILESLFGEIYPLEIKTYCIFGLGLMGTVLLFYFTKYALLLFEVLGYPGVFLMNAVFGFICLAYFWKFLPETKGRTLQEIELYFKNDKFDAINDLLKDEELHVMV